jgi:hypothetical protein
MIRNTSAEELLAFPGDAPNILDAKYRWRSQ